MDKVGGLCPRDAQRERVEAAEQLTGALNQFQAYVIQRPELRSNQLLVGLQDELAGTENRIAVERKRYNEQVAQYNQRVRSFPNSLIAELFGFQPKPLFEAQPGNAQPPQLPASFSP